MKQTFQPKVRQRKRTWFQKKNENAQWSSGSEKKKTKGQSKIICITSRPFV